MAKKKLAFAAGVVLAIACLGYLHLSHREDGSSGADVRAPAAHAHSSAASGALMKKVSARVQAGNSARLAQRDAFLKGGWEFVQADPPDARVMSLDLEYLPAKEGEYQAHLQSNTFSGEMLDRVREVALRTRHEKTRYLAIESLGRSTEERAQRNLIAIYENITDRSSRSQVLGLLKPASFDDSVSGFLIRQINEESNAERFRVQAALPLIVLSLSKAGAELPSHLVNRIDPYWQTKFKDLYQTVKSGGKSYAGRSD